MISAGGICFMEKIRIIAAGVLILLFMCAVSCGDRAPENRVPLEQLDNTKSNDYRYIFRETIKRQERDDRKYKKNEFRD